MPLSRMTLAVALLSSLNACSLFSPDIYDWDAYQGAMAAEVVDADNFDRLKVINDLREGLEQTPTERIPPGALLHLAFLMEQEGLSTEARVLLQRERELFPESGLWIDTLLKHDPQNTSGRKLP